MQLQAISSHPIASYLGEQTNTHLNTTTFQVVVEKDKMKRMQRGERNLKHLVTWHWKWELSNEKDILAFCIQFLSITTNQFQ